MKQIKLLAILFLATLTLSSCSEEENETPKEPEEKYSFKIGDKTFETPKVYKHINDNQSLRNRAIINSQYATLIFSDQEPFVYNDFYYKQEPTFELMIDGINLVELDKNSTDDLYGYISEKFKNIATSSEIYVADLSRREYIEYFEFEKFEISKNGDVYTIIYKGKTVDYNSFSRSLQKSTFIPKTLEGKYVGKLETIKQEIITATGTGS